MGGRPSKPTELILLEGKSHRTKAEIDHRKKNEQALYTGEFFQESPQVKSNKIAHAEFIRLRRLYDKITYVDALDQQVINRYCLEVANTYQLQEVVNRLYTELDKTERFEDRLRVYDLINKALAAQEKNKTMLLKYEDRLFLNPTGRMRAIPKTPEKKEAKTGMAAFMARRDAK
jgi:phage terminase small subunit